MRRHQALLVFALATLLRGGYVLAFQPAQETPGLARKYQACAENLLAGHGLYLSVGQVEVPFVDRMPGYVVVLAGVMLVAGSSQLVLMLAHVVLGALQAPLVMLAGSRLAGSRVGLGAGVLAAAWPPFWKSDAQLVETGVTGVAAAALLLGLSGLRAPRMHGALPLVAAASTALFTLRPDAMPIPLVAAVVMFLCGERGRRSRGLLAILLPPLLLGAAWAARNARVADGPFVSVGFGTNLLGAVGESLPADEGPMLDDRAVARSEGHDSLFWPDPGRRDRERRIRAMSLIRRHPAPYLRGCVRRVAVMLSLYPGALWPGETPRAEIARWRAEHPGQGRYEGLLSATLGYLRAHPVKAAATLAWGPLLLALAAVGCVRLRRSPRDLALLLLLPAFAVLLHVPLHAEPRYFFPYVGGLLVLAGVALSGRQLRHDGVASPVNDP